MRDMTGFELLRYYESSDYSYQEIADMMGTTEAAVRSRIYRAKKKIKERTNVEDKIEGNSRTISSYGRITDVDTLLSISNVDMDEWQIDRHYVGTHEGYRKDIDKDLTFDEGRITGHVVDKGNITTEPLFSIKVWLIRKNPEPVQPDIPKVTVTLPDRLNLNYPTETPVKKRALIVPDIHLGFVRDLDTRELIPFHDRRALYILLALSARNDFTHVLYVGDNLDLAEWSQKFVRSPEMQFTTKPALIELAWFMGKMVQLNPEADHVYIPGNHEKRMRDALLQRLPAAYALSTNDVNPESYISIKERLGLDELGIEFMDEYPNGEYWLRDDIQVIHGNTSSRIPGQTATNLIRDATHSIVQGHTHGLEDAWKPINTREGQKLIFALCAGFLGHTDYRIPGHSRSQNWVKGFSVVDYTEISPNVYKTPISNDRCNYFGTTYIGKDYVEQLEDETKTLF